jgi:CRISPR-associated protein Csy1
VSADPLQIAQALHRQGRLAEAIARYAEILEAQPNRGEVWHLRALAEHQSGQLDAASRSVARALRGGENAGSVLLDAMVMNDRGELAAAELRYARAAELRPGWAAPLANRGHVLMDLGRVEEALQVLSAAVEIEPDNARVMSNLALALLTLNRVEEAEAAFRRALALGPVAAAHFNLARIHNMRNETEAAFREAEAAVKIDPGFSEAHMLLGDVHRKQRNEKGMRAAFAAAVRAAPASVRARNAFAECLAGVGEAREAREEYRRIAAANPTDIKAALGANLTLPQVYRSVDELDTWRREFGEGMSRLEAAAGSFTFPSPREAMLQARWSNFYLAYQGRDDRELQSRFGDFLHSVLERGFPDANRELAPRPARDRLRVGFCSHFFFNCTAGRYFAPWITRLDRSRFESYVYYTNEWVADDTRTIAAASDAFRHLPARSFEVVARQVLADELDILVFPELGMHAETFTLASLRLAPVQACGWGHPVTTGLPNMDHFISCEAMEPPDAKAHYRESLSLLPGLGTSYGRPQAAPGEREDFGLPRDANLYLVPQSLFKIHPGNDALLARTIASDPNGKLVFFAAFYDAITDVFAARLSKALSSHGLRLQDRALFLPYMTHGEYLRVNGCCDVMLDTLHWSGGNTSLDAIACGLPMVTLPGRFMRGRQSAAMLRIMGMEELIAADEQDYIAKARGIASDRAHRDALSARIRAAQGELFDREEPIRAFEAFLERVTQETRGR